MYERNSDLDNRVRVSRSNFSDILAISNRIEADTKSLAKAALSKQAQENSGLDHKTLAYCALTMSKMHYEMLKLDNLFRQAISDENVSL